MQLTVLYMLGMVLLSSTILTIILFIPLALLVQLRDIFWQLVVEDGLGQNGFLLLQQSVGTEMIGYHLLLLDGGMAMNGSTYLSRNLIFK